MRKFVVICMSCILSATAVTTAQTTYPNISSLYDTNINRAICDETYVEVDYLLRLDDWIASDKEYREFINLFCTIHTGNGTEIEQTLSSFMEKYPNSFNKEKVKLLLSLYYLQNKETQKTAYLLDKIKSKALSKDDLTKYYLAYALTKASLDKKGLCMVGEKTNLEVNKFLEDAINLDSKYSENALFALSIVKWIENDRKTAYNIVTNTKFSNKLNEKAIYLSKVMAFDAISREKALADALLYLDANSKKADNTELKRSVGIAYYNLKDYPNANKYLLQVFEKKQMDYDANYVYANTLYLLGKYNSSIDVLKNIQNDDRSINSDMLMASCYLRTNELNMAINIYSSIIPKVDKQSQIAQVAIYNSALSQNKLGSSSFGESVRLASLFLNTYTQSPKIKVMSDMLTKAFIDSKNYEESLTQIDKLVNPTNDILKAKQYILVKLSNTLQDPNKYWQKKQLLLNALKLGNISPYYKEALFTLSNDELNQGQFQNAIKYSNEALSICNDIDWHNGLIYYIRGYAFFNNGEYNKSYQSFDTFAQNNNTDPNLMQDAYLRMGDCMYQGKTNLNKALDLYYKANEISSGSDIALLRISNIYSTKGEFKKEINVLNDILSKTTNTNLKPELMYRKAKAMVLSGDIKNSNAVFESIMSEYPDSQYSRLSMLENAMAYYNDGNKDKAIQNYKNIVQLYPNSAEASQAIADLKSIYMTTGNVDEFISYTKELGGKFNIDDNEQKTLMFSQAEHYYNSGDNKATKALTDYINKYPNGAYTTKAKSYLADLLYSKGNITQSLPLYNDIENDKSFEDIRQTVLIRLASIYSQKNDYKNATKRYLALYNTLSREDDKKKVISPMLKSLYLANEYKKIDSLMTADKTTYDDNTKNELYLTWAKSLVSLGNKKNALNILSQIKDKNIDTPTGAEAYVLQDQIRFETGDIKSAKKSIEKFIAESSSEQYWLAKAFILLSDIYRKQGDKVTAKQYLESLKNSYPNTNDDIQDLINQKLNKL